MKQMKTWFTLRNIYLQRFIFRCGVLLLGVVCYFFFPGVFSPLYEGGFFHSFTLLHLLWLVWMGDMLAQILPARKVMALGSQKLFRRNFHCAGPYDRQQLRIQLRRSRRGDWAVFVLWAAVTAGIGLLVARNIFHEVELLLTAVFFYVCDLICVLFWCPFRVFFMKNRCCTTCRIFNWDHLMMFAPFFFLPGFFGRSLLTMAIVVWLVWEATIYLHPERFVEQANLALRCSACTDRLCGKPLPSSPPES